MTGTLTRPQSRGPYSFYFDLLGFAYQAAFVVLVDQGWERPPRLSNEQHLFALLYSRAKAHKL